MTLCGLSLKRSSATKGPWLRTSDASLQIPLHSQGTTAPPETQLVCRIKQTFALRTKEKRGTANMASSPESVATPPVLFDWQESQAGHPEGNCRPVLGQGAGGVPPTGMSGPQCSAGEWIRNSGDRVSVSPCPPPMRPHPHHAERSVTQNNLWMGTGSGRNISIGNIGFRRED